MKEPLSETGNKKYPLSHSTIATITAIVYHKVCRTQSSIIGAWFRHSKRFHVSKVICNNIVETHISPRLCFATPVLFRSIIQASGDSDSPAVDVS